VLVAAGCAAPINGEDQREPGTQGVAQALSEGKLLALGDSIAFGYNPFGDFTKQNNFVGYPEQFKSDMSVKNASCPGESSGSFLSATAPDFGCRKYKATYPLHVNYGQATTQMDYAIKSLTGDDPDVPTLVTLNISGNDIFLLQASCASDPNPAQCFANGAPGLIGNVAHNVGTILGNIRGAGYQGRLVFMNLYATDYTNQSAVQFLFALNSTVANVARQFGAQIADAFTALATAAGNQSPCKANLLIRVPGTDPNNPQCDVHPSPAGQQVLAQSIDDAT
jgi:lysophospholipase L1-like esterase